MQKKSNSPKPAASSAQPAKSWTFENPDFAFPADVRKDALPVFEKALKDKDGEKALLAVMQLAVADRRTSRDSVASIIRRYDRISTEFPAPWKEMALLLKAKSLNEVYSSNRWTFDRRELSADELNPEPMLWSGLQFKARIQEALNGVFDRSGLLSTLPISCISGILTNSADAEKAGFSVLDFAVYQALPLAMTSDENSGMIPFRRPAGENVIEGNDGDTPGEAEAIPAITPIALIDMLIEYDRLRGPAAGQALFRARLKKMTYSQESNSQGSLLISGYPASLLELYPVDSPFRRALLAALYQGGHFNTSRIEDRRELYSMLEDAINGPVSETERTVLKGIMAQLTQPSYSLETQGQWLPSQQGSVAVKSRNVADGKLLLVPVSATQCEGQAGDKLMNRNLRPSGKIRTLLTVNMPADIPSERTDTVIVPPLAPGYYAFVMSATDDLSGIFDGVKGSRPDIVLVSCLSAFSSDDSRVSDNRKKADSARLLYVTDGRNNNPVEGAKVRFTSTVYNEKSKTTETVTDKDGKVTVPFRQCRAVITRGNERLLWEGGSGYAYYSNESQLSASILTDLALYHPGDSVQAVVVVNEIKENILGVVADRKIDLVLRDANYKEVGRTSLTSDSFGRAVGSLVIPAEGLTGTFSLQTLDGDRIIGRSSVQVAEYQAPTFRVTIDRPEVDTGSSEAENEICLSGSVMTYSGAPVADAEVTLTVNFQPWWRSWMVQRGGGDNYSVKVNSDSRGRYEVNLVLSADDARGYRFGRFVVSAAATSPAGETQSSSAESFAIGEGYSLQFAGNTDINADGKEIRLPVKVTDMLGNPVRRTLEYEIVKIDSVDARPDFSRSIAKGSFTSPDLVLPSSSLPSSLYMLRVVMPEAIKVGDGDERGEWRPDTLETQIIVCRSDDRTPPMQTALWVPEAAYYARPGQKYVEVTVGSSYKEDAVFCQVADGRGTLRREWLRPCGANMKVKVVAPKDGETVRLYFGSIHDLQSAERFVTVYPPRESRTTLFRIDTFRDRLIPGSQERWRFRLMSGWSAGTGKNNEVSTGSDNLPESAFLGDAAVIAVLSNAALDAITPFNWRFNPQSMLSHRTLGGLDYPWRRTISTYDYLGKPVNVDFSALKFTDPQFRYSGLRDLSGIMVRGTRVYSSSKQAILTGGVAEEDYEMEVTEAPIAMMSANAMKDESVSADMSARKMAAGVLEESAVEADEGAPASQETSEDIDMRSMEMPLAFFKPLLSTDNEGYVTVEFEVPNFNTEWNLQLLGYDRQLNSALLRESAVASKPVMVSTSMPRFLTTGDLTQITASVINNTDSPLDIDTQIDIFDLDSGDVLAFESTGAEPVEANSSATASITFTVPSGYSRLGVRAVSRSEKGSDGEQGALLVLPSSTPVSDAVTFYMQPGCDEKSITLPKMNPSDKVTLNFCNDPRWLILTALSGDIEPDSESALSQAAALYSNVVAGGLISRNAGLRKELERMIADGDSMLVSPLSRNQDLKLSSLDSTPWVNNAESETERMQNLSSLLDKAGMDKSVVDRISALAKTNNPDGSWSWMKGMPGSEWITRQVISCLGSLRTAGYLPSDRRLASMISRGVAYCDAEIGKDYSETVKKRKGEFPLSAEISYLYDRRSATDSRPSGAVLDMKRDMLRRLPKEWRDLSLLEKATAAILLHEEGGAADMALARTIMESVRQYASYTSDKGMWFDAASEGWRAPSPLWLTARCLEAFRLVSPTIETGRDAISGLEQYLILSRQTRDWNLELGPAGVACVANSILKDGIEESDLSDGVEAYLDGVPVRIAENGYVDLDPTSASGKTLTIHRHGAAPAWGGVLTQYVAPISDVKAQEMPQLKIRKSLIPVEVVGGQRKAGKDTDVFRKGDRIRVTLTVETDRDMDYVLLTDRLGSWMQPSEQLTDYQFSDGLWLLRETRRADVNFYITRIPKGRYILSYEVTAARDGRYSTGIAAAQSQYYPLITAHTAGRLVEVK